MILVNGCLLRKKHAEANRHLFLHCKNTWSIWLYFLNGYKNVSTMWECNFSEKLCGSAIEIMANTYPGKVDYGI